MPIRNQVGQHNTTSTTPQSTIHIMPLSTWSRVGSSWTLALIDMAEADKDYQSIVEAVSTKERLSELHQDHPAR